MAEFVVMQWTYNGRGWSVGRMDRLQCKIDTSKRDTKKGDFKMFFCVHLYFKNDEPVNNWSNRFIILMLLCNITCGVLRFPENFLHEVINKPQL